MEAKSKQEKDFETLVKKFNQAIRIKYNFTKKKGKLWKRLSDIKTDNFFREDITNTFNEWLNDFSEVTKQELKVAEIFEKGMNVMHLELKKLNSMIKKIPKNAENYPKKEIQAVELLTKLYKECKKIAKGYTKRLNEEKKVIDLEIRKKIGIKFFKKMRKNFEKEVLEQVELLKLLGNHPSDLDAIISNSKFLQGYTLFGGGTIATGYTMFAHTMMTLPPEQIRNEISPVFLLSCSLAALTGILAIVSVSRKSAEWHHIDTAANSPIITKMLKEGLI